MRCLGNSFLPVKRLLYSFSLLHRIQSVPTMADLLDEQNENDQHIVQKVKKFLQEGCGCSRGAKDGNCSDQFSEETVLANLNNCLELSSAELDLVILANIQAFTRIETIGEKRNRGPRCNFLYQSVPICKDMFLHLYGLSYSRFRRLKEHYENHGISQRTHGNCKRLPSNTLPQAVVEDVKSFLSNYVEENAILLSPLLSAISLGQFTLRLQGNVVFSV